MDAEKHDVDISKLFAWKDEFELKDENELPLGKVYIRLAGDVDINRARVSALRESARLRKQLHDPESDERMAFLVDKDLVEKENLVLVTAALRMREITKDAIEVIELPLPIEPKSDASIEIQERYQKAVDNYPIKRSQMINDFVTNRVEEEKSRLSSLSFDELFNFYLRTAIDYMCEQAMYDRYKEMSTYLGTYKDREMKERLFNSFEDFNNSRPFIKSQLINFYNSLEMDMTDLKKL